MRDLAIGAYDADDALIEQTRTTRRPALRIYRLPRTVVVLGRGSKPDLELNLPACEADAVPLLRRRGGGCAVVIDPGNVIVSLALPVAGIGQSRQWMHRLSSWLIEGLASVGVGGVAHDGISDLVWGGRKVSGACVFRTRDLLFYSATLLVDAELTQISRYLVHPPREPAYRAGRTHADFVGCIEVDGLRSAAAMQTALERALRVPPMDRTTSG